MEQEKKFKRGQQRTTASATAGTAANDTPVTTQAASSATVTNITALQEHRTAGEEVYVATQGTLDALNGILANAQERKGAVGDHYDVLGAMIHKLIQGLSARQTTLALERLQTPQPLLAVLDAEILALQTYEQALRTEQQTLAKQKGVTMTYLTAAIQRLTTALGNYRTAWEARWKRLNTEIGQ